ncbi:MAG: bifunctional phosphoribosylaminoimidazolecarboxamide formyltransferase/IMP cyclohydrolase [Omnitrophica bacterium RIFCSPLOWO2_01_FULL_45_10b]|nr:MAG: bifunctional phosphoribosylaminoimidazolecarboxamide formyltransferase/IMP cyclohydrolase [Omnitrophica bacterium RIFCSPLOWO2_01_FULL_45_10b]
MRIKRAIISVSDKTGLIPLAKELKRFKVEIFSTGGTLALLKKNKIAARSISELTGFPEILEGRVKTLHPKVHGGLLYLRSNKSHVREAKKHDIVPIDLVVVNLYPFSETIRKPRVSLKSAVEQIDIGGPTMLRSAAKNFESVAVISDPKDYPAAIEELKKGKGAFSKSFRAKLAVKVFRHTNAYDREIAHYLGQHFDSEDGLPRVLDVAFERSEGLRYGENPHQRAALYRRLGQAPRFSFTQIQGKILSYNNILDFESAIDILREFKEPAVCVVKHNNPCGIAADVKIASALTRAIASDPLSAFGGIVGFNRPCDGELARILFGQLSFFEVVIAPSYNQAALNILKSRKNLRIIQVPRIHEIGPYDLRFAKSGILLQDRDRPILEHEAKLRKNLKWVTHEKLKPTTITDLLFAWKCAKVVRSNAIVLTQGKQTVGIGGGQMSRVDSVKLACMKAGDRSRGAILASDGFFPMPDNIEVAHEFGIRAIIQPGGSIRDQDVIDACNRFGIAMAFTGERHFKH